MEYMTIELVNRRMKYGVRTDDADSLSYEFSYRARSPAGGWSISDLLNCFAYNEMPSPLSITGCTFQAMHKGHAKLAARTIDRKISN